MRPVAVLAVLAITATPALAQAAPTWADLPALIAAATATADDGLRACFTEPLPQGIALIAIRARDGSTTVSMPFPNVGQRGFTKEEECLMKAVARIELPPLPDGFDQITAVHVVTAAGAAPPAVEPAFAAWRDPAATVAALLDADHRAALAACDARPRTVRVVLDLRKRATRAWLPAWQFHSPSRDGTTPIAQRRIKTCLARAVSAWQLPVLPAALPELHLAIATSP